MLREHLQPPAEATAALEDAAVVEAEAAEEEEETRARIEVPNEEEEAAATEDRDEDKRAQIQLQLLRPTLLVKLDLRRRQLASRRTRLLWPLLQSPTTMTMPKSASSAPTLLPTTPLRRATTRHVISAVCA